jgi:iron(III) transport system permease protein
MSRDGASGRVGGLRAAVGRSPVGWLRRHPIGVLAVVISLLVVSPVVWILLRAGELAPARALELLTSETTREVLVNSVLMVGGVTVLSVVIGVPLAVLTVQTDLPFRRFWTVTAALPLVVPSYIGAFAFVSAFGPRGVLSDALAPLGIEQIPSIYGLHGAVLVLTLFTYPYVFLTTRASLQSFDGHLVEAARTLNQGRWAAFRKVVLPQIKPGVTAGALLVALYALSDFGTPAIMRYDVFTRMIYVSRAAQQGFAALLSLLLLAVTLIILVAESRVEGGDQSAYVSRGSRPGKFKLGKWKAPALAFCGSLAALCLALPLGILLMWLERDDPAFVGGGFSFEAEIALNSVYVAVIAAVACAVLALPIAYFAVRSNSRLARFAERTTYVGYAVPGVVLGLALIIFGLRFVPGIYRELPLLILLFAYVVRFLPQSVGTVRSSFLQVDPKLVEAADTLGASSFRSFRRIVLPLVTPGLVAGAALVFLTTMKELPATLLLRPFGFDTFVTYIWRVQEAGYYGEAAVPALVLVGISAISMLALLGRDRFTEGN